MHVVEKSCFNKLLVFIALWIVSDFKTVNNTRSTRANYWLTILEASRIKQVLGLGLSCLAQILWRVLFGKGSLSLFNCLNLLLSTGWLNCSGQIVLSTLSRSASSLILAISWVRISISCSDDYLRLLLWRSVSFLSWTLLQELANLINARGRSFGSCRVATFLASALIDHVNKFIAWKWTNLVRCNDVLVAWGSGSCCLLGRCVIFARRSDTKPFLVGGSARFVTRTSLLVCWASNSACSLALLSRSISSVLMCLVVVAWLLGAALRHHFLIEAKDTIHTGSDGMFVDSESSHDLQLIWPKVTYIDNLSSSHYDATAKSELIVLEELMAL